MQQPRGRAWIIRDSKGRAKPAVSGYIELHEDDGKWTFYIIARPDTTKTNPKSPDYRIVAISPDGAFGGIGALWKRDHAKIHSGGEVELGTEKYKVTVWDQRDQKKQANSPDFNITLETKEDQPAPPEDPQIPPDEIPF